MTLKKVVILFRILAVWFLIMLNFNIAYADFNLPNIIIINQNHITRSEINQRWQFFFNNSKIINQKNIKNITIWQEKLLEKLIEESLILENAQKLKLEVSPDELNDYLVQIAGKQQKTLIQWQNFLQKNNLDFSYYVKQVKAEILWLKIIEQKIKPKIQISNLEINEIAEQDNSNVLEPHFLIAEIVINNNNKNTR